MSIKTRRPGRPTATLRLLAVGTLLVATTACSTDVSGFGALGRFTLTKIEEQTLPTTLEDATEVLSGTIDLDNEANCVTRTVVVRPGAAQEERTIPCTWSRSGASLAIVWPDGSPSLGVIEETAIAYLISSTTPGCPPIDGASCAPSEWVYER